jgi:hypothetical protein
MYPELRANGDAGRPHANFEGNPRLRLELESLAASLESAVYDAEGKPGIDITVD